MSVYRLGKELDSVRQSGGQNRNKKKKPITTKQKENPTIIRFLKFSLFSSSAESFSSETADPTEPLEDICMIERAHRRKSVVRLRTLIVLGVECTRVLL